jgi:hypothetical protein
MAKKNEGLKTTHLRGKTIDSNEKEEELMSPRPKMDEEV